jgi:hypothetical protein
VCTTMSRSTARTPFFTVESNSADRVIRCRAGSTVVFRPTQAVNDRRPLRRRLDTIARPARVRIRRRNPCTRARRRLFGWKVRLPLATAVISSCVWQPSTRTPDKAWKLTWSPLVSRSSRSLTGADPGYPGSLPYRRLSGDCSRVLTRLLPVKRRPVGTSKSLLSQPSPPQVDSPEKSWPMLWNGWPVSPKPVSFCQCRFRRGGPRTSHTTR